MERFLDYFVPEKYELNLEIDKFQKKIGGIVKVTGETKAEVIKFHAVNLKVSDVTFDGAKCKFEADGKVLTIFDVDLGKAEIEIHYEGKLNENMQGAYLSTYQYKGKIETIVATQFESHYAREAFPSVDEPAAKAVFELSLTTADSDDVVLSNMPIKSVVKNTTLFEQSPRMSTYLLAWVIGKFKSRSVVNKHGTTITTYVALNQNDSSVNFANEVAARSLEFYDDSFGVPYPLKKLDQVALPDFEAGAMENWGLVTYRESMLLVTGAATLSTMKSVALTVAHELSHQWFGDLVTMEWWDDLWLNESFASVMEYFATDVIFPEFKIWESFFTGDCLAALKRDCISGVQSVHQDVNDPEEIATLFDGAIVYAKGARLMLMIIRLMGWEAFNTGIRDYFEKYKYKNTVGDNLWDALNKYADFDVKKMMHAFIDRPGYPVVSDGGAGDFKKISQKRFLIDGGMSDSDWLLPEITEDMSGHYILNLSDEEFEERLARFDVLNLEEKLRLLIDRELLSKTGLASSASLLPLIFKFREETSAAVWSIILTIVSGLKPFFKPDSEEEKMFQSFVRKLVAPGLERVGLATRENDDENTLRLRSILLALDFYAENKENLYKLASMYSFKYSRLDKEIRADILDAKLYVEPNFIDEYINRYQKITDPDVKFDLMVAMTLTKNMTALTKVIELLDRPDIVKPQDQFYLYLYLYRNPVSKKWAFEWLKKHWDYVKKMSGDKSLDNYPRYMAGAVRTKKECEGYKKFFGPMKKDPALARAIEMGENEIGARLKLLEADREPVMKELRKMSKKI
ncbi:M1 family metallopeptidase [Candidatus Saccharibacteria bacterium]|nr:M1 family metallopeptidase [Candidatus Saccharibacteria bacterium]